MQRVHRAAELGIRQIRDERRSLTFFHPDGREVFAAPELLDEHAAVLVGRHVGDELAIEKFA